MILSTNVAPRTACAMWSPLVNMSKCRRRGSDANCLARNRGWWWRKEVDKVTHPYLPLVWEMASCTPPPNILDLDSLLSSVALNPVRHTFQSRVFNIVLVLTWIIPWFELEGLSLKKNMCTFACTGWPIYSLWMGFSGLDFNSAIWWPQNVYKKRHPHFWKGRILNSRNNAPEYCSLFIVCMTLFNCVLSVRLPPPQKKKKKKKILIDLLNV